MMSIRLGGTAFLACWFWILSGTADAGGENRAQAEKILAVAGSEMEKAGSARTYDEAQGSIQTAVDHYQRLIQMGFLNGYVYYNLGNGYLRLRNIGEAIYWLRMAERWIPRDSRLRANLRFARTQIRVKFPPPPAFELIETLFFFHFWIPFQTRLLAFLVLWNFFWVALISSRCLPALRRKIVLGPVALIAVVLAVSVGWDLFRDRVRVEAVVLRDEWVRKGAATTFDPVFTEPASAGLEVDVIQQRNSYAEIRFGNGSVGWIPVSALRLLAAKPKHL